MIRLTRLNRSPVVVNADRIAFVESTPDTLVTLTNGETLHVSETLEQVVALALQYQREVRSADPARTGRIPVTRVE